MTSNVPQKRGATKRALLPRTTYPCLPDHPVLDGHDDPHAITVLVSRSKRLCKTFNRDDAPVARAKEFKDRHGRIGPARNTVDDDMTLAELMGVPGIPEESAIAMLIGGISTGTARKEQIEAETRQFKTKMARNAGRRQLDAERSSEVEDEIRKIVDFDPNLTGREIAAELSEILGRKITKRRVNQIRKDKKI